MSLAISRTPTPHGTRIHFDGFPESSKSPLFGEHAPLTFYATPPAAQFLEPPRWPCKRLWHVRGRTSETQPVACSMDEDEDDEVLV